VESHAPAGYRCPFCRNVRDGDGEADYPLEILHRDDDVFVKMNPKWWPNNPGGVLVVPVQHYENIFDLPVELAIPIQRAARSVAIAMKTAFACDGISTRQHNEPAGNQDVWHYHLHVFPRWHGDDLYRHAGVMVTAGELRARADQLRRAWPAAT
jgi:histidine triad (HIT) family protein